MRLVSLETKGFKSFADKTVINFNDNITGIVGPNGCGKSNVIDSIRWVLGEQKTSALRSDKMENVIFNGSKKRKASSLAEVSLTFENTKNVLPTEYTTVTITRMLYRNGESEYKLNGISCRLKDITNLFLDTGIGSDSYAIIELGMVDEILNDREHSRRRLFEQAAGISKYKTRKRETLNKLSATEGDLNRVEDLLFEINDNLKSLESQARRTKRYYQLKEEYQTFSVEHAKHTLSGFGEQFKRLKQQQQENEDKRSKVEVDFKSIDSTVEKEKLQSLEKEKQLSSLQKELNEKLHKLREQENQKNLFSEKAKFLTEKRESVTQQISDLKDQNNFLAEEIKALEVKKNEEQALFDKAQKELEQLLKEKEKHSTEYEKAKKELGEVRISLQTKEREYYELEKKLEVNTSQLENLKSSLELSLTEKDSREGELKALTKELKEKEQELDSESAKIKKLEAQQETIEQAIGEARGTIDTEQQKLVDLNRKLDAKQNEYDLTKDLVDSLEGFPESVRFLKKEVAVTKNAPLLSDIISCGEEYRVAIENYLEPYLNHYVVNNREEAIVAINILSDASKGRANFFLLDQFKAEKEKKGKVDGVWATDVIDVEQRYTSLCRYLLRNVVLVDGNDVSPNDDEIYVSKNGKFVQSSRIVSGGAVGLFEGKRIGRGKNLEKLKKEIDQLNTEINKCKKQIDQASVALKKQEEASRLDAIRGFKDSWNIKNSQFISLKAKVEGLAELIKNNNDKEEDAAQKVKILEAENENVQKQLVGVKELKSSLQLRLEKREEGFREIDKQHELTSQTYNSNNIEVHKLQNALNSTIQQLTYKEEQLKSNQSKIEANQQALKDADDQIKNSFSNSTDLEKSLIKLYEEKEAFEKKLNVSEENYYKSKGNVNELEQQLKELSRQKEQLDTLLNEIREKVNELKLTTTSIRERLSVEFNIDVNEIINQEPDPKYNADVVAEKVEKLKGRLDNYGEINPMAVEAFDEMQKRFDFITNQKNDLLNAKQSLLDTIDEIDGIAKEKFLNAFTEARENFIKVFHSLFSEEDQCDLILSDEENPLEAKIEIIAKPKGKKPLTINQLSGGEKTLTATALLFSLYLLKPAPFCIFDEVDAPLDDTNIAKFNNIIKDFSSESQFIIVTHNKQTMSFMDVIYGVTMAEEGVSKLVPVDFRALKKAS